jgi:ATP-dependent protease ClpP protease subunit
MNEILLYYPLYDFTISPLLKELDAVTSDFTVRMSSPGGEVFPSWGVAKKIRELSEKGFKSTLKIDGISASMAGILSPFFDRVEAIDKAKFMIHAPSGGDKKLLKSVAKDLTEVLNARIDAAKFKALTGITVDEAMDPDSEDKKDIWLSAQQAKDIGLIDEVVKLTPALKNEIESKMKVVYGFTEPPENSNNSHNQNHETMTYDELKNSHSALFNQILAEGKETGRNEGIETGKAQEQIRVKSWLAHHNSDTETVVNGIKEGKELTADVREELIVAGQMKKRASTETNADDADTSAEAGKEMDEAMKEDVQSIKNSL